MGWRAAADLVLISHLLFIVFVVAGGIFVQRSRVMRALHLTTVVYGVSIQVLGFTCPLTPLEKMLRASAGQAGYEDGFVEHYIVGLIYPGGLTVAVRILLAAAVIIATLIAYVRPIRAQCRNGVDQLSSALQARASVPAHGGARGRGLTRRTKNSHSSSPVVPVTPRPADVLRQRSTAQTVG